jgi:quercetin dioxygenase-like cupin family protein
MKAKMVWALVAAVLGATVYGGVVFATPSSGLTTTILAKSTFDDLHLRGQALTKVAGSNGWSHQKRVWLALLKTRGLSDIYVVDNKIAAGGTTGWHSHAGPSLIFVVAGSITNYTSDDPSCTPQTYTAGQGFVDPGGNDEHILRNEGTTDAETIAVQFLPQGADRKIDVTPSPGNCPF